MVPVSGIPDTAPNSDDEVKIYRKKQPLKHINKSIKINSSSSSIQLPQNGTTNTNYRTRSCSTSMDNNKLFQPQLSNGMPDISSDIRNGVTDHFSKTSKIDSKRQSLTVESAIKRCQSVPATLRSIQSTITQHIRPEIALVPITSSVNFPLPSAKVIISRSKSSIQNHSTIDPSYALTSKQSQDKILPAADIKSLSVQGNDKR